MSTRSFGIAIVTAVLLLGCGARNRNKHFDTLFAGRWDNEQIPVAAVVETKPWQVGQWARYKTTNHDRTVLFEHIRVVDEGERGTWIEWVDDSESLRTTWLILLRPVPNPTNAWPTTMRRIETVVRLTSDEQKPRLWDFEDGRPGLTVQQLLGAKAHKLSLHALQALPRGTSETIDVPAGHFAAAIHSTYDGYELWSHPAVPFGGMVKWKTRGGGWERELLAYGESDPGVDRSSLSTTLARARETCPATPAACEQPVHTFLAIGWGFSRWTEADDVETGGGPSITLQLGQRLLPGLHLVEEMGTTYGGNSALVETHTAVLLGLRWTPFRGGRRVTGQTNWAVPVEATDWTGFYLKATTGAFNRARHPYGREADESTWAPAANAALGWLPLQGRQWAFGAEYRYQFAWPGNDLQRDWAFVVLAQLSN